MPRRPERGERAVLGVAEGVVGEQPPRGDAVVGEEVQGALDEAGHGERELVVVQLDVGQAASGRRRWRGRTHSRRGSRPPAAACERSPVTAWPGRRKRA